MNFAPDKADLPTAFNPLNHPIVFTHPRRLSDFSVWREHVPFAMLLMDLVRPDVFVELGTHYGDSYCAFCQAVESLHLSTRCFAVDTWQGDPQAGFYGADVLESLRAHHDPLYSRFSHLIQSTFDDSLGHFADQTIDLLHIDGLHTYEAVRHDFEAWLPKMSRRGVILFHDTYVTDPTFGVKRLWEEISPQYPHFEFFHGNGLGILAVGQEQTAAFQALLRATEEEAASIRALFFELGSRLILRVSLENLQTHVRNVEAHVRYVEAGLSSAEARAQHFEAQLQDSQAQLQSAQVHLQKTREHFEREIERLNGVITVMRGSPFWKLRTLFVKLKKAVGISSVEVNA